LYGVTDNRPDLLLPAQQQQQQGQQPTLMSQNSISSQLPVSTNGGFIGSSNQQPQNHHQGVSSIPSTPSRQHRYSGTGQGPFADDVQGDAFGGVYPPSSSSSSLHGGGVHSNSGTLQQQQHQGAVSSSIASTSQPSRTLVRGGSSTNSLSGAALQGSTSGSGELMTRWYMYSAVNM
jgi:hypothetical protein